MYGHGDGKSPHNPKSLFVVADSSCYLFPYDLDHHDSHFGAIQNDLQGIFRFLIENAESLSSIVKWNYVGDDVVKIDNSLRLQSHESLNQS
jgi:hypothetical protein